MNRKTDIRPYFPVPFAVLKKGLSMTAVVLYGILLNRYLLSESNHQVDEHGEVYLVYPITALMDLLDRKKNATIDALHELEKAEMIKVNRRGFRAANMIYVNIPKAEGTENQTIDPENQTIHSLENQTFQPENQTQYVGKSKPDRLEKPNPNNYNNNIYNNQYNNTPSNNNTPPSYQKGYRGRNTKRKDTESTMFAPIPDYEKSGFGYGY